ncbi:flavin reductase [Corallococcus praedator]|uniref:Flavin reductase n=1 Tax=Corallococcus praedator TaxID=2316724 RepID=A0ABX9QNM4_9BACT|nr:MULTISPECIES: flavin reductase family protein [Corallococcus]RKH35816.1 flavin reductase [Corallococcus sp. CA031C]RKI13978.1 flavin reductase [Corallococcus praedator]
MSQSGPEGVSALDFREAMSRWASGVAVVSVRDAEGVAATTVSSFSSLSLSPPLVVLALQQTSRTLKRVEAAGRFSVSVLSTAQREISVRCAKGDAEGLAFDERAFVQDSLAGLGCDVLDVHRYGDHLLLVGRVVGIQRGVEGDPLVYWNRGYRAVTAHPDPEPTRK